MGYATSQGARMRPPTEVTQGFVRVGCSGMLRPVGSSSQEGFDTVLPDAVFRQDAAWTSALIGMPGCTEDWRVQDTCSGHDRGALGSR